jgi:hypothetical protein
VNKAKVWIIVSLVLFFNRTLLIGKALGEDDDINFTRYYQFVNQFG